MLFPYSNSYHEFISLYLSIHSIQQRPRGVIHCQNSLTASLPIFLTLFVRNFCYLHTSPIFQFELVAKFNWVSYPSAKANWKNKRTENERIALFSSKSFFWQYSDKWSSLSRSGSVLRRIGVSNQNNYNNKNTRNENDTTHLFLRSTLVFAWVIGLLCKNVSWK